MVIDCEAEVCVCCSVHEADTVFCSSGEGCIEAGASFNIGGGVVVDVRAVDQTIGHRRGTACCGLECQHIGGLVRPVVQEQVAKIFVVICRGGAVDDDSAEDTVPGLHGEVRVVPAGTVLGCAPGVGEGVAGSDGALCDAWDAVHLVGVVLADAVKVDSCTVVGHGIGYVDNCRSYNVLKHFRRKTYQQCHPNQQ